MRFSSGKGTHMYNSILFYTFASNVLSPSMKGQRVLHFEIVLEKCQGSCCHRLIVITAGTQGTPSRTYLKAKREARVKGLGPHTSGSNLSTAGETSNAPASMATNQNRWASTKASPRLHEAAYVHIPQTSENTLSHTFKDTEI